VASFGARNASTAVKIACQIVITNWLFVNAMQKKGQGLLTKAIWHANGDDRQADRLAGLLTIRSLNRDPRRAAQSNKQTGVFRCVFKLLGYSPCLKVNAALLFLLLRVDTHGGLCYR